MGMRRRMLEWMGLVDAHLHECASNLWSLNGGKRASYARLDGVSPSMSVRLSSLIIRPKQNIRIRPMPGPQYLKAVWGCNAPAISQ
jgi:hypothetical protein